jgi:AraC-like DNA-binding protein
MTSEELDNFLREPSEREEYYRANPGALSPAYRFMERKLIKGREVLCFQLPELKANDILIRKDSRYVPVPYYIHTNVNMNYIYSGSCSYEIDDKSVTLEAGDVCIFDRDVVRHKFKTGENDIIINISMSNEFFSDSFFNHLKNQSIMASFLLSALSNSNSHDQYLIFRTNHSEQIREMFLKLLLEYFDIKLYRKEIMKSYLMIIIIELLRLYSVNNGNHFIHISSNVSDNILDIINYIELHYADCTLGEVAEKFGYHPKYLSTLIRQRTHKTFKEIQTRQRMIVACSMLENTNHSIQYIASDVGISNLNQFYKHFQEQYQMLPNDYRKLHS